MTGPRFAGKLKAFSPIPGKFIFERYAIALATGAAAIVLRWALDPLLGHVAFYVTVYMAVAFCVLVCGFGPAVLSAAVGFLGIFYWFVDPRHSLLVVRPAEIHAILGCFFVCAVLIGLGAANRSKQFRLNDTIHALTTEAAERKRAEQELQKAHVELEQKVEQRTAELSRALEKLEGEIAVRRRAEQQMRTLSVRLMTLQDEERRRIARDLHDTTGQTLAAIKMTAAAIAHAARNISEAKGLINDLNGFTDEALRQIRTTSYLLHPPLLDEAGIASAARWFVEGFAKRSGIQVRCDIPEKLENVSRNCEMALFRILQESLTNVHRHSQASTATVAFRMDDQCIRFEISDNGCGIPEDELEKIRATGGNGGVGIAGMSERARELGGQLKIDSDADGTKLSVILPATVHPASAHPATSMSTSAT